MTFKPGDVVVVPFPYSDQFAEKRRPAIVVSDEQLEADHMLVWLAMITSTSARWRGDVAVSDLRTAGLSVACFARPAKVATAHTSRILRRSGKLSDRDWKALLANLRRYRA